MKDDTNLRGFQTKAIHVSDRFNSTAAISAPIWQTSTFRARSSEHFDELAHGTKPTEYYTRYGNPTHRQVEETIAALEGGEAALVTGSGMGAITTSIISLLQKGDHVVAQQSHYAGAKTLLEDVLPRWGIECTFVDQTNPDNFAEAIRPSTKLIYIETPTNPLMRLTDLRAVADLAKSREITTIADNTLATPVNQLPLEYGIDVVVHSTTKYIGGHSDVRDFEAPHVFVFTMETEVKGSTVHSRAFLPASGIAEDPGTGGASGPLGCYLVRHKVLAPARKVEFLSEQGLEIGRPSFIKIRIEENEEGEISAIGVGGRCRFMGKGYFEVDE